MTESHRELEHEFQKLKELSAGGTDDVGDVSVSWREAAPDVRPTGIEFEADAGVIHYDLWGAQFDTLEVLDAGEDDIVGFLAGYGGGKRYSAPAGSLPRRLPTRVRGSWGWASTS